MQVRSLAYRMALLLAAAAVCFLAGADAARAEQSDCQVRRGGGNVIVLICPTSFKTDALSVAGKKACGDTTLCNAWIWDDPAKAPAAAPFSDSGLTEAQAADAVAVWINDSQRMMVIRKAAK